MRAQVCQVDKQSSTSRPGAESVTHAHIGLCDGRINRTFEASEEGGHNFPELHLSKAEMNLSGQLL